ncbi:hypothetical protein J7U46_12350 [Pelomonas sp. V22]|uniref:hypothetical protein n=1 Tax=Pelomonas sp. V22 TaxID=2822139 RepID=UPI0024A8469A|nr:hypothetical protein [Pelomonas sp. V22]MDI4633841.1 hypothetical protein [Pelomonas sp. V22]
MFASIRVNNLKTSLAKPALQEMASQAFPAPAAGNRAAHSKLQSLTDRFRVMAVYDCAPCRDAQALFLWSNESNFEIIVESEPGGDLRIALGNVVSQLQNTMKGKGMKGEWSISLKSLSDDQTYITGRPYRGWVDVFTAIWPEFLAFIVGVLLIFASKQWFPGYLEEAKAVSLAYLLLLLAKTAIELTKRPTDSIIWNAHEAT